MPTTVSKTKGDSLVRVNTRIKESQDTYIKREVTRSKKLKVKLSEGEVTRELLDEAIAARKAKSK